MIKITRMLGTLALGGGMLMSSVALAATPSAGMLADTCAGCHGTDGASWGPATPTIAGISEEYFIETMQEYRDGARPGTIMSRIAKGYTDEEIKLMAKHFSSLKFVRHSQATDPKLARKGAKLHKKYCEKCHEDGGRSTEDDAGILAGQWMPYLEFTLEDFLSGDREMPKKMAKRIKKMKEKKGDEAFTHLLHFYGSATD